MRFSSRNYCSKFVLATITVIIIILLCVTSPVHSQAHRAIPTCLTNATQVEQYGWRKNLHLDAQGKIVRQSTGSVILEYNAWSSSNITTYIAATLLHDVIGVNVSVIEFPSTARIYERVASGVTDFVPEVWPENKEAQYDSYIVQKGIVQDFGLIGFNGIFSIYVNGRIAEAHPGLVWIIWQSYRLGNPVLNYLPPFGTTPPARTKDGEYLCDSETYPWCANGVFIPPQCRADPSQCRELWHLHPSYTLGSIEQFITTMNLALIVVYIDDTPESYARLLACGQQSTYGCIFGYWEPAPLLAQASFLPVVLPTSTPECWANFDPKLTGTSQTEMRCGWSPHILHKIGSPRLATQYPHIFQLLRYMSLKESTIMSLLSDNANGNSTEATACNWIKANEQLWARWIQEPPEGYIQQVTALDLDSPLTILIYSLCCILGFILVATSYVVIRWRKSVGVREHSPLFLLVSLAGLAIVVCSVGLEMHPPRTPVMCSFRVWCFSLGFTILLSGILVKTWRISRIFSNRQLYSKPLKDFYLFAAVFTLAAVDVVLLAAWTASSSPAVGYLPLSSSSVLYNCTYPTGDTFLATVITALLIVYHAALLLTACVLGYQIRNVATVGNESRFIATSAYNIALIGVFVIPISFMPLNPLIQIAIKCLGILLAVAINLSLLVLRTVVYVFMTRRSSLVIGQTLLRRNRGMFDSMDESKGGKGKCEVGFGGLTPIRTSAFPDSDSKFMVEQLCMCKEGALFPTWHRVTVALIASPFAMIYIATQEQENKGQGECYTKATARARPMSSSPSEKEACFTLNTGQSGAYLVQTNSQESAVKWAETINSVMQGPTSYENLLSKSQVAKTSQAPGLGSPLPPRNGPISVIYTQADQS